MHLEDNLARVRADIDRAARAAGRSPDAVRLIAVSKTKPAVDVIAALDAGQRDFGENYLQEAETKIAEVRRARPDAAPVWHFIGAIQSNKTRAIATHFDWVHTVSREKIARRLNDQRPEGSRLAICLQVNVDGDPNKAGVAPEETAGLLAACRSLERLDVRGLMTILDPGTDPGTGYGRLRSLFDNLADSAPPCWDTLSMGMSGDYREAIVAGATQVRVGTAIFGAREPSSTI